MTRLQRAVKYKPVRWIYYIDSVLLCSRFENVQVRIDNGDSIRAPINNNYDFDLYNICSLALTL